ncbi:MAG: DEAD/DEAH box helicase family protein [Bacteroidota bacterium]
MTFKNISFPDSFEYRSDSEHIPLEFYNEVFPVSKTVDLFLGYFNSGAFRVLSESFAEFIYNGGSMRMITNHCYTKLDFENLIAEPELDDYGKVSKLIKDLRQLKNSLDEYGQLFFDCLKYLIKVERLQIQPVSFGRQSLSHNKKMLFYDGEDYILTQGSMNFTLSGIVKNSESFQVEVPWNGHVSQVRIKEQKEQFEEIFNKENQHYTYLDKSEIEQVIEDLGNEKSISELLQTTINLGSDNYNKKLREIHQAKKERFQNIIEQIENEPRFPYSTGPRDYQKQAYENWVKNDYKGIFAMATGTGKTITSLNCVLEEYLKNGNYKFIVLVPTRALVEQWQKEILNNFNFKNLISVNSKYFYEEVKYDDKDNNSCLLVTYATFKSKKFQKVFNKINYKNLFTLIADEAHNMGAKGFLKITGSLDDVEKRIGLSATPSRYFDDQGEKAVYDFFKTKIINDRPKFAYSLNISEAINAKPKPFLCPYKYKPKFVELDNEELERYRKLTKRLLNYIDENGKLKKNKEVENILKLRKDVIKKAKNKKQTLIKIINEIGVKNFKYAFVYVPEGKEIDYTEDDRDWSERDDDTKLITDYTHEINKVFKNKIPIRHFTGETKDRNQILEEFSKSNYYALFAMKCLDEGVDVPRTEIAIFCSSTGNPRQYVQRRGRVLRLHEEKKQALIYDMIVIPLLKDLSDNTKEYKCEKNLVKSEIRRLIEFAKDSNNYDETLLNKNLIRICNFFKININEL